MFLKKVITVQAQAIFFVVVTGILFGMLLKPIFTFSPLFEEPKVEVRSAEAVKNLKKVNVGLSIDDFVTFNFKKNIFVMKGAIWFEYDPAQVDIKSMDDFYVERGTILQKHGPIITNIRDHLVRALYYITCEYGVKLNYAMFPFDDHRVFLGIVYPSLMSDQYVVSSNIDSYVLGDNINLSGWIIKMHKTKSGVKSLKMPDNTSVGLSESYFSIGVTKRDFRLIMLILLPLLLIFYLGMFSLSLIGDKAVNLALTSVSGLIAYRYVINTLEPEVSYLLVSDYFFILLLLIAFIIFGVNLFCSSDYTKISLDTLDVFKGAVLIAVYVCLIVVWYYLTHMLFSYAFVYL